MIIIPTVLEKEWPKAENRLEKIKELTTWIQIDVTDGNLCFGKTFELEKISKYSPNKELLWDIHLMVKEPTKWLEKCIFVGASRVIGQVEMMKNREDFVNKLKDEGMEAGLAFDIETEIDQIPKETDLILLMGRKMGFGNLEIDERIYEKIKKAKVFGKTIAVDGGVNENNFEKLIKAGAEIIYSGNSYFKIYDF